MSIISRSAAFPAFCANLQTAARLAALAARVEWAGGRMYYCACDIARSLSSDGTEVAAVALALMVGSRSALVLDFPRGGGFVCPQFRLAFGVGFGTSRLASARSALVALRVRRFRDFMLLVRVLRWSWSSPYVSVVLRVRRSRFARPLARLVLLAENRQITGSSRLDMSRSRKSPRIPSSVGGRAELPSLTIRRARNDSPLAHRSPYRGASLILTTSSDRRAFWGNQRDVRRFAA